MRYLPAGTMWREIRPDGTVLSQWLVPHGLSFTHPFYSYEFEIIGPVITQFRESDEAPWVTVYTRGLLEISGMLFELSEVKL